MANLLTVALICVGLCSTARVGPLFQQSMAGGNSSIAGRVTEHESARPLESVIVTLVLVNSSTTPLTTQTDADGRYAFESVSAGAYRVELRLTGFAVQDRPAAVNPADGLLTLRSRQQLNEIDFKLTRGASIHGQITDQQGQPLAGVSVVALLSVYLGNFETRRNVTSSKSDDRGNYLLTDLAEGNYLVTTTVGLPVKSNAIQPRITPTYYPGTTTADEATLVKVGVGDVLRDVNIMVATRTLVRVAGQVVRGNAMDPLEGIVFSTGSSIRTLTVSPDGAFELTDVTPGRYTIVVRTQDRAEAGALTLDFDADMSGLSLALNPTSIVKGRVVVNDGGPLPTGYLQITAVLAVDGKPLDPLSRDRSEITDEGNFELRGLFGERTIDVIGLGDGWRIDRVLLGARPIKSLLLTPGAEVRDLTVALRRP